MKNLTPVILALVTLSMLSCKKEFGNYGPVVINEKSIGNFEGIDLRINGTVHYSKDSINKIEVIAPQDIQSMIETKVINNKLVIRFTNGDKYYSNKDIRINVSGPDMTSLELSSSGSIICETDMQPASLYLRSTASGNILLKHVTTGNIDAETKEAGNITALGGSARDENLKSRSSGKIDFAGIAAENATVRTDGSGSIRVNASDKLDVTIDGSGSVYFTGYPLVSTHISGSGRLFRL